MTVLHSGEVGRLRRDASVVHLQGQDGAEEFLGSDLASLPSGVLVGDTPDGVEGYAL